jgi:hypothetical protein
MREISTVELSSSGVAEAGNGYKCNCAALKLERDQQGPDF